MPWTDNPALAYGGRCPQTPGSIQPGPVYSFRRCRFDAVALWAAEFSQRGSMTPTKTPTISADILEQAAGLAGFRTSLSRRRFLVLSAGGVTSFAVLSLCRLLGSESPVVILEDSTGLLLGDSSRCVGCLRCELACTEFNDGRAQPSMARIKVSRNLAFGPEGPTGGNRMQGAWGNGLVIQDTCRQCPHPVPCASICPVNAIKTDSKTGARVVAPETCIGCRLCQRACPWDMITFDDVSQKATKCFLCQGAPECVEACPAGALRYIPWRDLTRDALPRRTTVQMIPPAKAGECLECHVSR